jgi:hypothetical protein
MVESKVDSKIDHGCADCGFRKKYDQNPRSILGRMWHWHAGWCPGWKKYMASLTPDQRRDLADRYHLPRG